MLKNKVTEWILDTLIPPSCLRCERNIPSQKALCSECAGEIEINKTFFCGECRARVPENRKICHLNFPYLLGAASEYDNKSVQALITGLKFNFAERAAVDLGRILADYARATNFDLSQFTILPIPLHRKRERERGFNQSKLIALEFSRRMDLPMDDSIIFRIKSTHPQSQAKNREIRFENVARCFSIPHSEKTEQKNFVLIDDVITSGATMNEATRVLKLAGARKILAMVAARA